MTASPPNARFTSEPTARTQFRNAAHRYSIDLLARRRNQWAYLALAALGLEAWIDRTRAEGASNSGADDEANSGAASDVLDPSAANDDLDDLSLLEVDSAGDGAGSRFDKSDASSGFKLAGTDVVVPAGGAGLQARSLSVSSGDGIGGGGGGVGRGGSAAGPGPSIVTDPGSNPTPFVPVFDYFGGLNDFADALGLGKSFHALVDLMPDAAKGLIGTAFAASDNGLAPVGIWSSMGKFSTTGVFDSRDQFNAEYTVQANGYTQHGFNHTQGFSDVNDGFLLQFGDSATKSIGNVAQLVDGQDWGGALIVRGNYYEFNTIIQINVTWNNDTIEFLTAAGYGPHPGLISTGGNTQVNEANIVGHDDVRSLQPLSPSEAARAAMTERLAGNDKIDAADADALIAAAVDSAPPAQVFAGGVNKHNAAIQTNILVQEDTIEFLVADKIVGSDTQNAQVGNFADVQTGGQVQHNASVIGTGLDVVAPAEVGWQDYMHHMQNIVRTNVSVINGDYFEFNTIFQINIIEDSNSIRTSSSALSDTNSGLASGGNIQLNAASLEKNDGHDYLYVGGQYSQYNLVLQINALETHNVIRQVSDQIHGYAGSLESLGDMLEGLGNAIASPPQGNGANGGQFGTVAKAVTMPGMNIDMTF